MRLVTVTLWLLAGAALTGGAYWAFLITPESTGGALAASGLLIVTAALLAAITVSGAIIGWRHGLSASHLRGAMGGVPAAVPAALVVFAIWWLVGSATDRITIYSGQINAWFIASLGWDDVSWLFTGVRWFAAWLKWVVAPMLAFSLMASLLAQGWHRPTDISWFTRALAPRPLVTSTLLFAVLVAVPWIYLTPWRPTGLPATSIELAFIIAKLSLTALLMAIGAALIIRQASTLALQHPSTSAP
jgi:hypothetical protein